MSVKIIWQPEDVQTLYPALSYEEAEEALYDVGNRLQDRSIELGWEVLSDLLSYLNLKKENV